MFYFVLFFSGFKSTPAVPEVPVDNHRMYGQSLNFYSWSKRELIQTVDLGVEGITPLEVRFLHDPKSPVGFVGSAFNSKMYR